MTCSFDCLHELPLVFGARPGDPLRNDPSLFGDKPLKAFFVFVVDVDIFRVAEAARPFLAWRLVFIASCSSWCKHG